MVKEIPLQNGMIALVDDEDYERVSQFQWHIEARPYGKISHISNRELGQLNRYLLDVKDPKILITHKNKKRLDNRKDNLTTLAHIEAIRQSKGRKNATSKYKGVSWNKANKRWHARILLNGKNKHLGYFVNEIEAAKAYNSAVLTYLDGDAYINILNEEIESYSN